MYQWPLQSAWFRVQGLGFLCWSIPLIVYTPQPQALRAAGCQTTKAGFRVWGLGFRVRGLGFRVWGLVLKPYSLKQSQRAGEEDAADGGDAEEEAFNRKKRPPMGLGFRV